MHSICKARVHWRTLIHVCMLLNFGCLQISSCWLVASLKCWSLVPLPIGIFLVIFTYILVAAVSLKTLQLKIKNNTERAFYHLHNISMANVKTIVHAFATSCLNYSSVVHSGLPASRTKAFKLVQNAAALHWLPVYAKADFKVLLLTHKILYGLVPAYLSDLIRPLHDFKTKDLFAFFSLQTEFRFDHKGRLSLCL